MANSTATATGRPNFSFFTPQHHPSLDGSNWEKWLVVNFKINKLPNIHIVDRYLEAAAPLGVKSDALGLDYFIPEKDEIEKDWLPLTHQKEYVAFAIGGNHETKKLPLNRMIELCDKINKPIVLLGGKEDAENGEMEGYFAPKGSWLDHFPLRGSYSRAPKS